MQIRLLVVLVGLLLPMLASCSLPRGTYQRATIQDRAGIPCFGVPSTRETRANAPIISGVTVIKVGMGPKPVWERVFLRPGSVEPTLPPNQCLVYGEGAGEEDTPSPVLQTGVRYEVVISGGTPDTGKGEQTRVFSACFYMVDVDGKGIVKPVVTDCTNGI